MCLSHTWIVHSVTFIFNRTPFSDHRLYSTRIDSFSRHTLSHANAYPTPNHMYLYFVFLSKLFRTVFFLLQSLVSGFPFCRWLSLFVEGSWINVMFSLGLSDGYLHTAAFKFNWIKGIADMEWIKGKKTQTENEHEERRKKTEAFQKSTTKSEAFMAYSWVCVLVF